MEPRRAGGLHEQPESVAIVTQNRGNRVAPRTLARRDEWLRQTVALITQSKAWLANGVLFITWDEDDGSARNQVLTLVVSPKQSHKVSDQPYTHYSLLATIEDLLGVGRLGNAKQAKPMTDLLS